MMRPSPKKRLVSIQSHREPPMVLSSFTVSDNRLAGASEREVPAMDGGDGVVLGYHIQQNFLLSTSNHVSISSKKLWRSWLGPATIHWNTHHLVVVVSCLEILSFLPTERPTFDVHPCLRLQKSRGAILAPCPNFHLPKSRSGRILIKMRKQGNNNGVSAGNAAVAVMKALLGRPDVLGLSCGGPLHLPELHTKDGGTHDGSREMDPHLRFGTR